MPPENGDLLRFGLRLREEAGAAQSLPTLLAETREAFALEAEALARFESMLAQTGYSPVNDADYAQMNLRIVEGLRITPRRSDRSLG